MYSGIRFTCAAILLWGAAASADPDALPGRDLLIMPREAGPDGLALLTSPPGWKTGHPVALVVVAAEEALPARATLVAELLARGVAVLELRPDPAAGAEALDAELRAALAALRAQAGVGAVAAYGWDGDAGGAAVLRAAESGRPDGFAAHAALGRGCRAIVPGRDLADGWRREAVWRGSLLAAGVAEVPPDEAAAAAIDCALAVLPEQNPIRPIRAQVIASPGET